MAQGWEYLFVTAGWDKGWRAQWLNDEELPAWQQGPVLYAFANQLGDEGWELVTVTTFGEADAAKARRLIFKRARTD